MLQTQSAFRPDMIITVGDNFYEDGVKDLNDEHWQKSFEQVYGRLTHTCPWYVSLGNHDYRGSVQAQVDYHSVNPEWNMPDCYYTFARTTPDHQQVRFIVIDTNPFITPYYSDARYRSAVTAQDTLRQLHWLDSVLANAHEPWKIVYGHHPLYSAKNDLAEVDALRNSVRPILDKYHVQAYICGHDHLMQFNQPKESNVSYIVSGGGAKLSEKVRSQAFTVYSGSIPGFTVCTIQSDQLVAHFIDTLAREERQYAIQR